MIKKVQTAKKGKKNGAEETKWKLKMRESTAGSVVKVYRMRGKNYCAWACRV